MALGALLVVMPNAASAAWVEDANYAFPGWDVNAPNDPDETEFQPVTNQAQEYDLKSNSYTDTSASTGEHVQTFDADGATVAWAKYLMSYDTDITKIGQGVYDSDYTIDVSIVINSTETSMRYSDASSGGLPQWDEGDTIVFGEFKSQSADWEGDISITEDYMGGTRTITYDIDVPAHGQAWAIGQQQAMLVDEQL